MREAEFRAWFEANDYDAATIGTQLARAKRIEQSYGDLDALYRDGKLAALKAELSYSSADERANRPNPAKFPVNGNIRNSMASYCSTIEYYSKFCGSSDRVQQADGQNITSEAIEAAMDEFDDIGLEGFKSQYGFGTPQKYWVKRPSNGKNYPAKAIVGVSHGHVPGGVPLKASDFYGGQGEQAANGILRKLGYEIVSRGSTTPNAPDKVEPRAPDESKSIIMPTNLILYGPPGTGKTYNTALEAVKLCDSAADYPPTKEGRAALMTRYNELVGQERIGFVTFHQNYGYEDFVEGLRPSTYGEDGEALSAGFRLAPEAGIFTKIAERAEALRSDRKNGYDFQGKRLFKMSLGEVANPEDDYLFDEAIEGGFVHMGDDGGMDWSESIFTTKELMIAGYAKRHPELPVQHPNNGIIEFPYRLRVRARVGDIIVVSKGNLLFRAIGEVTGEYHQVPRENDDYTMRRAVKWLWVDRDGVSHDVIYGKRFSQRTIYEFTDSELKLEAIGALIDSGRDGPDAGPIKQFVLIIDEINRANVSKVFGELITLLEPDKRAGMDNALSVTLPYSKRQFSVPANLHVIGTMNTADRSIALLDTALRRRFNFREMAPEPDLLADASKRTGIDLVRVLTTINQRIEYLIDREHRIGHAFFIGCETAEQVHAAMRDKVIPLLQEYFFEDWSRIHAVLGDGFIREDKLDPPPGIEGDRVSSWSVLTPFKANAFERLVGQKAQ
jgi:5-methylcytosine-specific restriction protein B